MGDFDDPRLLAAMRAYVAAADAIAKAAALDDDRATMDRGDERVIAAMSLRRRLTELGWVPPDRASRRSPEADPASGADPSGSPGGSPGPADTPGPAGSPGGSPGPAGPAEPRGPSGSAR